MTNNKKAWLLSLVSLKEGGNQIIGLFHEPRKLNDTIAHARQINPKMVLDVKLVEIIDN